MADTKLIDGLVMAHAALVVAMNSPRAGLNAEDRRDLEQVAVLAEQKFSGRREALRGCPTYQRVSEGERWAIERSVCQVRVPEG